MQHQPAPLRRFACSEWTEMPKFKLPTACSDIP
jgi:hypothetical protein